MLRKILSNKLIASFSILASGSIIAQLLSIIISPITTRLFTPEEFGFYTIIFTAISLFGPVISLKYDMSIMTVKTSEDTNGLIKLSILISFLLSLFISIIYGVLVLDVQGIKNLIMYIFFIFFLLFFYGLNNVLLAKNNKSSLYKLISTVTILKSGVNNILLIISGLFGLGVVGLVGSQLISSIAGVKLQAREIKKDYKEIFSIKIANLLELAWKFRSQPLYNATSALINTAVYSLINLFIYTTYTATQLGLYSISYRVLGIPFSVISANIARVFFEKATVEKNESGDFSTTFLSVFKLLCLTILPIMILLALIAPMLFSVVFGEEWKVGGDYVRLLTPMFAVKLIAESLTTSFIVSNKQKYELIFQISLIVGEILIFALVLLMNLNIEILLILISVLYVVVQGIMIKSMHKLSKETKN